MAYSFLRPACGLHFVVCTLWLAASGLQLVLEARDLQLVVCSFWLRLVAGILWLAAHGSLVNKKWPQVSREGRQWRGAAIRNRVFFLSEGRRSISVDLASEVNPGGCWGNSYLRYSRHKLSKKSCNSISIDYPYSLLNYALETFTAHKSFIDEASFNRLFTLQ